MAPPEAPPLPGTQMKSIHSVPLLQNAKTYEIWKKQIELWLEVTDVAKTKRGITIALSLPEECSFGKNIASSVLEKVSTNDMKKDEGYKYVLKHLDEMLAKDLTVDKFDRFKDFVFCKKTAEQNVDDFITEFDSKVSRLQAVGQKIDGDIITFMLLLNSNLQRMDLSIIMSRIDFEDSTKTFESAKKQMRLVLGSHVASTETTGNSSGNNLSIKSEPTFVAEGMQEAYATQGYGGYRGSFRGRGQNRGRGGQGKSTSGYNGGKPVYSKSSSASNYGDNNSQVGYSYNYIKKNALGKDGKPLRCRVCESTMHFAKFCPHKKDNVNCVEEIDEKEFVYFSNEKMKIEYDTDEMSQFTSEALNCAALDTCCTSSVAGEKWMKIYIDRLPKDLRESVKGPNKGIKKFQFGNLGILESVGQYSIPVMIAGGMDNLIVDVIKSDIPLLMSKIDMQKRGMVLDLPENKVSFKGKNLSEDLGITSAGHYILPLMKIGHHVLKAEEVWAVDLKSCTDEECKKALDKLHKQFGHRPKKCFTDLLKSAGTWSSRMESMLDKIIDGCEGCILRKRSPDRPAVAMPMANDFNEKLAIDLKHWKGGYILYMIDMFTRFTQAAFITRKAPEQVVDAIMEKWIAHFGVPGAILNDNGGEFCNAELEALKAELNVVDLTTGAESPFQNGLCEKNHFTMDNILERIETDYSKLSINAKLAWATMAKNSLLMVFGYNLLIKKHSQSN